MYFRCALRRRDHQCTKWTGGSYALVRRMWPVSEKLPCAWGYDRQKYGTYIYQGVLRGRSIYCIIDHRNISSSPFILKESYFNRKQHKRIICHLKDPNPWPSHATQGALQGSNHPTSTTQPASNKHYHEFAPWQKGKFYRRQRFCSSVLSPTLARKDANLVQAPFVNVRKFATGTFPLKPALYTLQWSQ